MRARGADFSSAQDLAAVRRAADEITFGFVKTTQGVGYINPSAQEQFRVLNGKVRGVYHFLTADADGAAQWDHFEAHLVYPKPHLFAVDHETLNGVMPPDHIVQAFIRRGHQRGFKVGRYANGSVFRRAPSLGEDWRWVAWWAPTPPPFKWDVWQFSDGDGKQDWNVYNGDLAQLKTWAKRAGMRTRPRPVLRWWLHDDFAKLARGPFRLPAIGAALVAYAARHPKSSRLRLERK